MYDRHFMKIENQQPIIKHRYRTYCPIFSEDDINNILKPTINNSSKKEKYKLTKGLLYSLYPHMKKLLQDSNNEIINKYFSNIITNLCGYSIPINAYVLEVLHDIYEISKKLCRASRSCYLMEIVTNIDKHTSLPSSNTKYIDIQHKQKKKRDWWTENKNPFELFNFSVSPKILQSIPRVPCPKCKSLQYLYCCKCLISTIPIIYNTVQYSTIIDNNIQYYIKLNKKLQLPIDIDIIYHPNEKITKSTGIQGCILAPECINLYKFPDTIPQYSSNDTVILYPSPDAKPIESLDLTKLRRVIVIESTWQKSQSVLRHPNVRCLLLLLLLLSLYYIIQHTYS